MGVGILVTIALPDSPSKAWFFNAEGKKAAVIRLAENQTGVESHKVRGPNVLKVNILIRGFRSGKRRRYWKP